MRGTRTRPALLRLGRAAVGSTVTSSGLDDPRLPATVQRVFDRMAADADWPDQVANQVYLVEMVLPVAAFYRALRDLGWDKPDAIRTVHHAFLATGDTQRMLFVLLLRTRLGARLFLRALRPNWLGLTPPPANQWAVTRPPGAATVRVEVSRCYRLDAFRQLGTPDVAFIACLFEGYVMDVSPHIAMTLSSMATGAQHCRFRFELLDRGKHHPAPSEVYPRQPLAR